MDPWNTIGAATALFTSQDITYSQVLAAKKGLQLLADNKDTVLPIVQLCLACADNDVYSIKDILTENKGLLNKADGKGLTPLIYAIVFHNNECVDLLLTFNVDCNEADNLVGWTPVMWATHLDFVDLVERLISYNSDPLKKVGKSMKNAIELIKKGSKCEEYYKIHGYLREKSTTPELADDFLKGMDINKTNEEEENKFINDEDVFDSNLYETFNFNYVQKNQYIKFHDSNIRAIMDYVFKLPQKYHNKPLYPSSIIFQCLRYAESKMASGKMVETLVDLYLTRIRNVIGTKSGIVQFCGAKERKEKEKKMKKDRKEGKEVIIEPNVDIVTIGYWISAINHLYYFLLRDTACDFLKKYPKILQDLISCLQSGVFKLVFSIDSKLEGLLDSCILEYNSVPDLNVIYKNDWKIFKKKDQNADKTSYDEIIDMLYPPTYTEQMKPSPLKVIQTLGALVYVLELFHINDVIKQQCLGSVLYFIGCSLFNRVLNNKKYCSRVKGMEIRLNLSYIQDWLRMNNLHPSPKDEKDTEFPDSLIGKSRGYLDGVCRYEGNERDPNDGDYYMNPLYNIGQFTLSPIIELAEWLQVLSGIQDLGSLQDVISNFEILSSSSMVESIRNYHYEVDEKKFSKSLKKWLKENPINNWGESKESKNMNINMNDKGIFLKEDKHDILLNYGQVFNVCLPQLTQLLHQYGADFTHVDEKKLRAYQPHIPLEIRDEIEIEGDREEDNYEDNYYEKNAFVDENSTDDYENNTEEEDHNAVNENRSNEGHEAVFPSEESVPEREKSAVLGTELFDLTAPESVARKAWNDTENPWA